jgi:hypothetical protein
LIGLAKILITMNAKTIVDNLTEDSGQQHSAKYAVAILVKQRKVHWIFVIAKNRNEAKETAFDLFMRDHQEYDYNDIGQDIEVVLAQIPTNDSEFKKQ